MDETSSFEKSIITPKGTVAHYELCSLCLKYAPKNGSQKHIRRKQKKDGTFYHLTRIGQASHEWAEKKEGKQKPNVSHEIDLSEIKTALAGYIEDTRGTIMKATVIRIRGDKMIIAGNSQKK